MGKWKENMGGVTGVVGEIENEMLGIWGWVWELGSWGMGTCGMGILGWV
jgi:hypothetical protein